MKGLLIFIVLLPVSVTALAQSKDNSYSKAFQEQVQMLKGEKPVSFKRAVFLTEDAYYRDKLNYQAFCEDVLNIAVQLRAIIYNKGIGKHPTAGNFAAFSYMTDSIPANSFKPFTYDFDDFTGTKDWSKQFVTKLIKTHSGNCHSLPYLYKILCEEIGAQAYLAFAPNHCYIKHRNENGEWTNVELTNPSFPPDQEIIKQMYVTVDEIRQNVYMKPLSEKESVAMSLCDLADGYKAKYGYDKFFLQVINTALIYYPKSIDLLQNKANGLLALINSEKKKQHPDGKMILSFIALHKQTMHTISALGYKEMPIEMYKQWVKAVEKEKAKRGLLNAANKKI